MNTFIKQATPHDTTTHDITLYSKNYMSPAYKENEKAAKKIIKENMRPTEENT